MLDLRRWCAGLATAAACLGAVGLAVSVAGSAPFRYVSESGVAGAPHAGLYRASMLLLAASLALLAVPARHTLSFPVRIGGLVLAPMAMVSGLGGLTLAVAAPLAGLSGLVTCSPGCPLPPYETPTANDLVHAAGAIGALLLLALVMLLYATQPDATALRRVGRFGILVAYPPLILSAAGIALLGRGLFTGLMERTALVAVSAWLIMTAALHIRGKP
ncbi:hypothetical protein GCM10010399_64850 [Dactylosporangium fulvum]|uniref:DUF998 domain-containing protein n=1 Tax=Dactylosporangium fulvum TaxID=53359 RepID=A0ABY5VXV5_9ACTN|nr:DUF998 domain-containing protein [Dactylosporangium fulvum]UWP82107.1 DUF998 domain-containing protein [Dactylosporangium fulvum]